MTARLGLFLCVVALAGCSVSGTNGGPDEQNHAGQSAGAKALPVQSYILTDEQRGVVHRAAQRIADACMTKQGFDVGMPDMFEPRIEGLTPNFLDRRYSAVYDEKTARKYGLHVPLYVEYPRPPVEPELSEEASEALWGPPDAGYPREEVDVSQGRLSYGGCAGEAEAALSKGMRYVAGFGGGYAEPVRMLNLDDTPDEDPGVKAAQAAWLSCMAEGGYNLTSTMDDEGKIPGVDLDAPVAVEGRDRGRGVGGQVPAADQGSRHLVRR